MVPGYRGGVDAAAWNRRYAESELVWSAGPNAFVEAERAPLPPGEAIDLAAGEGRNALWLAELGWQVTAVDFAEAGLAKGRAIAAERDLEQAVAWVCADAADWVAPTPADLVVIAYLQLPAAARAAAIRTGFESLTPGGTLLVVAHDSSNLEHGTGGPQDPAVLYTAEDVLADLSGLEFTTIRAERVDRTVTAEDGGSLTAYDCLVRVVRGSGSG